MRVWKYIHNKSLNINIGTVIKNQEILKFVPDHFKNKKMCKYAVKKLPYLLLYNLLLIRFIKNTYFYAVKQKN